MSKRLQSKVDAVSRISHSQLLKQDKRLMQKTRRACLVSLTQRDVGLPQECTGQLRVEPLAPGGHLSCCQMYRCLFPLAAQGGYQPQHAVNEEPVMLTAEAQ